MIFPSKFRFARMVEGETVKLKPGNLLFLVTDGLAKTLDPNHGLDSVLDVLDKAIGKSAATARKHMESALDQKLKGASIQDDATMLAFRIVP